MLECPVPVEPVVVSSFCTRTAQQLNCTLHRARTWTWPRSHVYACAYGLGDACLVWGQDSLVLRLGYMYNARRNPRSLQYYSRVDVPSTVTPQRLREGDNLQERCVLGSRGVRPHPTNPPWLRPWTLLLWSTVHAS